MVELNFCFIQLQEFEFVFLCFFILGEGRGGGGGKSWGLTKEFHQSKNSNLFINRSILIIMAE